MVGVHGGDIATVFDGNRHQFEVHLAGIHTGEARAAERRRERIRRGGS